MDSPESRTPWTTYRRADGELIMGEYAFMTETDCFEDDEEWCVEVVEETWQLVGSRILRFGRCDRWCDLCDEDVTLTEPTDGPVRCATCEERRPWPGYCQNCKALLDPPDRKDCPTCLVID